MLVVTPSEAHIMYICTCKLTCIANAIMVTCMPSTAVSKTQMYLYKHYWDAKIYCKVKYLHGLHCTCTCTNTCTGTCTNY